MLVAAWIELPVVGSNLLDEIGSDCLRYVTQPSTLRSIGTFPMQTKSVGTRVGSVPVETFDAIMARSWHGPPTGKAGAAAEPHQHPGTSRRPEGDQ